jgi:hypothetical protein
MATDRRKQLLLGALLIALAVAGYRAIATTSRTPTSSSNRTRVTSTGGAATTAGSAAPDVHLEALKSDRPKPVDAERNLFSFKPKTPPPAQTAPGQGQGVAPPPVVAPTPPAGAATLPPIPLKFIGTVNREGKPTIAVLSDGQGLPLYGVEGGTVGGRYRILRIGVESIEMSYLDGRGRQTIRLTGS